MCYCFLKKKKKKGCVFTGPPAWLAAVGCVYSDRWASWYYQTAYNLSPLLLRSHSGRCSPGTNHGGIQRNVHQGQEMMLLIYIRMLTLDNNWSTCLLKESKMKTCDFSSRSTRIGGSSSASRYSSSSPSSYGRRMVSES